MQKRPDSLNLGGAGSLLLYEVYRGRARSREGANNRRILNTGAGTAPLGDLTPVQIAGALLLPGKPP